MEQSNQSKKKSTYFVSKDGLTKQEIVFRNVMKQKIGTTVSKLSRDVGIDMGTAKKWLKILLKSKRINVTKVGICNLYYFKGMNKKRWSTRKYLEDGLNERRNT